jgi:hypothetical protein
MRGMLAGYSMTGGEPRVLRLRSGNDRFSARTFFAALVGPVYGLV